jgi:hypothetical protein
VTSEPQPADVVVPVVPLSLFELPLRTYRRRVAERDGQIVVFLRGLVTGSSADCVVYVHPPHRGSSDPDTGVERGVDDGDAVESVCSAPIVSADAIHGLPEASSEVFLPR